MEFSSVNGELNTDKTKLLQDLFNEKIAYDRRKKKIRRAIKTLLSLISTMLVVLIVMHYYSSHEIKVGPDEVVGEKIVIQGNRIANDLQDVEVVDTYTRYYHVKQSEITDLDIYNKNQKEEMPFTVSNMLPGDTYTKYYMVRVSHIGSVKLKFCLQNVISSGNIELNPNYGDLGDALKIKVTRLTTADVVNISSDGSDLDSVIVRDKNVVLIGTFNEVKDKVFLDTDFKDNDYDTTDAYYRVDVYLDKEVGNEYQYTSIKADYMWFYEDEDIVLPHDVEYTIKETHTEKRIVHYEIEPVEPTISDGKITERKYVCVYPLCPLAYEVSLGSILIFSLIYKLKNRREDRKEIKNFNRAKEYILNTSYVGDMK